MTELQRLKRIERRLRRIEYQTVRLKVAEICVEVGSKPLEIPAHMAPLGPALVDFRRAILAEVMSKT